MTIIDPPGGWKYGFPKPIPEERRNDTTNWLIEQGYPKELISEYGEYFFCRYWQDDSHNEQQKELIKEIMDLDAKDGLYEDASHRGNPRPDDVEKLAANLANPNGDKTDNWEEGYLYAKETLYTEEQVIKFAEWCRDKAVSETVYGNVEKTNNWELRGQQKVLTTKELLQEFVKSLKQPKKD